MMGKHSASLTAGGLLRAAPALASLAACRAAPIEDHYATLERSSLYLSTATAPQGLLELEFGTTLDPDGAFASRLSATYGLTDRTEVFADAVPFASVDRPGTDARGVGDLVAGVTVRLLEEGAARPSAAFQLAAKLPIGEENDALSSGEIDVLPAAIATKRFGGATVTAVYRLGLLGDPDAAGAELEHSGSFSLATTLADRLAGFAALEGGWRPGSNTDELAARLGIAVSPTRRVLVDLAARIGIDDAPDLTLELGVLLGL